MTITKRNNKYYCRFQINGERHHYLCEGATTKQEAEQIENGFKYKVQQRQNGIIPNEEYAKLNEAYKMYTDYAKLNKKSWKKDLYRLEIIKEIWKNITYIKDIKFSEVEYLKIKLLERGVSKVTVNRYLEILSKMFNLMKDDDKITHNPIKKSSRFPDKNYSVRYLNKEEEKRLNKVLPLSFKQLVKADLLTGLRRENICELTWSQINMDLKYIELLENKGNKHLIIPINSKLYRMLDKTPKEKRTGYVFINPNTGTRYRHIERMWHKWIEKAKIEKFRFHDLRHTYCTRLAEEGVAPAVLKELMGHSDIRTTERYIHITQNALRQAVEKL